MIHKLKSYVFFLVFKINTLTIKVKLNIHSADA